MRRIIFVLLVAFSSKSFSENYYWKYINGTQIAGLSAAQFSSPEQACHDAALVYYSSSTYSVRSYKANPIVVVNGTYQSSCVISLGYSYDPAIERASAQPNFVRVGTTCPAGTTLNTTTQLCDPPAPDPCLPKAGSVVKHEHVVKYLSGTTTPVDPPVTVCDSACQYSNTFENQYCYRDAKRPDQVFCKFDYKSNGKSCTASDASQPSVFDQPPSKPPIPLQPQLIENSSCTDWVTQPDGTGKRTCTGVENYNEPGKLDCVISGTIVCGVGKPSPASTNKTTTEETTKKTNPDGSVTTTTTSKTTTACFGVKPCSTTTTTHTHSTTEHTDGTKTEDSACTGPDCGKEESTDPTKDPDETKDEEEKEPRVASGGGSCDAPPSCSGDAIDCAMLAEQHKTRCDAQEAGDFPKHKSEIEGLLTGDKFNLKADEEISAESFINSGTRFLPASCPADTNFSLSFAGGHSYALSYSPFCFFAESLSPLIVIAATLFAALYVGRAFGGE